MKKLKPDFNNTSNKVTWYDLREDWGLIEASLAKQYGIRIRHHSDMPWSEFCTLVGGLMPDTPLGQIITIRSEKDPKVIKAFTSDQRRIHKEWQKKQADKLLDNPKQLEETLDNLAKMLETLFADKGVQEE